MVRGNVVVLCIIAGLVMVLPAGQVISQDGGGGAEGGAKPEGDMERMASEVIRNWPTPEEMQERIAEWRKRREDRTREQLGATEEEWLVLKPRIEKVQSLQRSGMRGRMRGMFSRWSRRGRDRGGDRRDRSDRDRPERPERELSPEQQAKEKLEKLLDDETAKTVSVKTALDDLRKARQKRADELAAARKELREVCSLKQEGRLVLMGILE